jgi:hypothetical protein
MKIKPFEIPIYFKRLINKIFQMLNISIIKIIKTNIILPKYKHKLFFDHYFFYYYSIIFFKF